MAIAVAQPEHHRDNRRALRALSDVRIDQASPQGAFHNRPTNGSAKKAMATMASTNARAGIRSRPTRR
jgi:hypothetical protein